MIARIEKGLPHGRVSAPPSKSYAHRELICAALSGGSKVTSLSYSEDIEATLNCLSSLGFIYYRNGNEIIFKGRKEIDGVPLLDCNASGSTLRFMIPVALILVDEFIITGTARLLERGIDIYENICDLQGILVEKTNNNVHFKGKLCPAAFEVPGDVSSQYITGLLLALPLLNEDSTISILPPVESKNYIDITLDVLKRFGVLTDVDGLNYQVKGQQRYERRTIEIEGDYSNAAFLDAWNYLGGEVVIDGLNPDSKQGDKVCLELLRRLSDGYKEIDISNCIDLGPILICFAALKYGAKLTGTKRLGIKESNRGLVMKEELEKLGASINVYEDEIEVAPLSIASSNFEFRSHDDHRIAMSLSLFAAFGPVIIEGAEAVRKSFPNFFDTLKELGMEVSYEE